MYGTYIITNNLVHCFGLILDEETFTQIEIKITNFINVIDKFEDEKNQVLKHEFDTFIRTCSDISKNIEEALKR